RKFNTTVAILKKLNALTTNSLSIGQQLVIN
ncbi:MAG: LysM peptidoglycan-binding domain-containing protein, partial [Flavobacteriaceae bacterium]|nr:LysM peptidoglycan-binding domain-containing protein [Flavobacteriaceae bacterium]